MIWQDAVFFVGQFVFIIALLPILKDKEKPPIKTSVINTVIIGLYVFTMLSLKLWFSAFCTAILCLVWAYIGYQRYKKDRS